MRLAFFISSLFLSIYPIWAQSMVTVTPLNAQVSETSGLVFVAGKLITHNDSGGAAALYELDTTTGDVTRTVVVQNASNIDWEAITRDADFIYVGDFGNNNGDRTDLSIYKISIEDYINSTNDTVVADTIQFSYADQTQFNSTQFSTNFDAEAFIVSQDSLYIFTKNWGNYWTSIYGLPKQVGNYSISKIDSINVQGLITDACYHIPAQKIWLTGYTFSPFLVTLDQVVPPYFSNSSLTKTNVTTTASVQIEGIIALDAHTYYISSETHSSGEATLYRGKTIFTLGLKHHAAVKVLVYPNPVEDFMHIQTASTPIKVFVFDTMGKIVLTGSSSVIACSELKPGLYVLKCMEAINNQHLLTTKFMKY
ncbi:hypothetical protein DNU06_14660 [Putridiphycobacter roseus]|uniref:Secretion system C-terminal sorting domain-containing protein n=1 Tax=Putridiphycobacter roseus TaxID=2219161 RepID=A0A2W1MZK8_9FLAO|nr:T9SS type A sorting domain-containing protein [Putridiphycobacter roseus]PZE16041.1 hypothetical protein DNU06_14660 [Putridiphycobacter roseus]